jgi:hypothetical protein
MSSNNQNNIINPKSCTYGCNTQIYWNTSVNEYWEVFTQKKHICPNRVNNKNSKPTTSNNTKPTYYNKKSSWNSQATKPKTDNSLMLLLGSIENIQKHYEFLSDLIRDHNGKVHGSQRDKDIDGNLNILVYYEVPLEQRDEVKRKFDNYVLSIKTTRTSIRY